jgi:alpha-tubulin suppressor-like RCC1 family protein
MSMSNHSFVILQNGTLMATGQNNYGQLGISGGNTSAFTPVPSITHAKFVSCGANHSVVLLEDGTLMSGGLNTNGQLGIGSSPTSTLFVPVPDITGVKSVACGSSFTVILMEDGTIMSTGFNSNGQLGQGSTAARTVFAPVAGITGVKSVACGNAHTVLVMEDGTIMVAGYNNHGQLGLNDNTSRISFTPVPDITEVKSASCGSGFTILIMEDGTMKAAGYGGMGQTSVGGNSTYKTFTPVIAPAGVKHVSCGTEFSMLLMRDGRIMSTGSGEFGQTGIGTTGGGSYNSRSTFGYVEGISGVNSITCGSTFSFITMADGTIMSTGQNNYGQLGTGSGTSMTFQPVPRVTSALRLFDVIIFFEIFMEIMTEMTALLSHDSIDGKIQYENGVLTTIDIIKDDGITSIYHQGLETVEDSGEILLTMPLEPQELSKGLNSLRLRVTSNQGIKEFPLPVFVAIEGTYLVEKMARTRDILPEGSEKSAMISYKSEGKSLILVRDGEDWRSVESREFFPVESTGGIGLAFLLGSDASLKAYGVGWK